MKPGYRVQVIENFLRPEIANRASNHIGQLLTNTNHVWSTNFAWITNRPKDQQDKHHQDLKFDRYNNLVLVHQIYKTDLKLYEEICKDITRHHPNLEPERPASAQYFVWTGGSNIEWHNDFSKHVDKKRRGAITIYLNHHWPIERGGDFFYRDEHGQTNRVTPSFNLAVSIGNVDHRSTRVEGRHFRKAIQIFVKEKEPSQRVDIDMDFC